MCKYKVELQYCINPLLLQFAVPMLPRGKDSSAPVQTSNSSRDKPLSPEVKKLTVSVKQYFDRNKLASGESSVKRTADALGIGMATVKRIMADYNRDPNLLDKPAKARGRPGHVV